MVQGCAWRARWRKERREPEAPSVLIRSVDVVGAQRTASSMNDLAILFSGARGDPNEHAIFVNALPTPMPHAHAASISI